MPNKSIRNIAFVAIREPQYSRVSIVRSSLKEHYRVTEFLSTHKRYARRILSVVLQLLKSWISGRLKRYDAVVVGFFAQPIFPLVRLLYRGPIVADAYFSIFDTVVNDKKTATANSWKGRICRWLDRHMLSRAELCLTDTLAHAEYFRSEFETPHANIQRLWIGAECNELQSHAAFDKETPFEVFFWGGFIPLQGVETIIEAADLLRSQGVHFTIFGTGQTYAACQQLCEHKQLDHLQFCGWRSPQDIVEQAERSHLALGIFGTTEKAGRVIPNKVFEALAMGLPLITRHSQATEELLVDGRDAYLVSPANPQELADKILWVRTHYDVAIQVAEHGRFTLESLASRKQISQLLHQQIESALVAPWTSGRQSSASVALTAHSES